MKEKNVLQEKQSILSKNVEIRYDWRFLFFQKPLKLATYIGFISVAIGILYALIALITKLINPSALVTGWTTIIVLIVFSEAYN